MFEIRKIKVLSLFLGTLQAIFLFALLRFMLDAPDSLFWPGFIVLLTMFISVFFFATILYLLNLYQETNKSLTDSLEQKNIEINKLLEKRKSKTQDKGHHVASRSQEKVRSALSPEGEVSSYTVKQYTESVLSRLSAELEAVQSLMFLFSPVSKQYQLVASYAYYAEKTPAPFSLGEGLSGQVAKNKKMLCLEDIPEHYMSAFSGLGISKPRYVWIVPLVYKEKTLAVIELATFRSIPQELQETIQVILNELATTIDLLAKEEEKH